ncbi:ISL3 family transposase, partial [Massilia sp. CCM 8694]
MLSCQSLKSGRLEIKGMAWGMRKDHADWTVEQSNTMYRLQRSNLKSARAWRMKE